jgi:hypothetical protein
MLGGYSEQSNQIDSFRSRRKSNIYYFRFYIVKISAGNGSNVLPALMFGCYSVPPM